MFTLRLATAVATSVVGGSALFAPCEPTEPDVCPNTAPEEGCPCAVESEIGCTADGQYHSEGFVCLDGYWTDVAGTAEGDALLCPGGFYGGCNVDPATGEIFVACAVPGFIGISRARAARRAAAQRVRPARRAA